MEQKKKQLIQGRLELSRTSALIGLSERLWNGVYYYYYHHHH